MMNQRATVELPDINRERSVHAPFLKAFDAHAQHSPGSLAVSCGDNALTYAELRNLSRRLAAFLFAEYGVTKGDKVAVCVHPRCEHLASVLAIFRLGAIYVPLDPTHPEAHTRFLIEETKPRVILSEVRVTSLDREEGTPVLDWDDLESRLDKLRIAPTDSSAPGELPPDAPCYLMFTSGTTGKPKGVVATTGNLRQYLGSARDAYGFGPTDTFCSIARTTFSISLFELLSPLYCGGSVRLLRREDILDPAVFCKELESITVLHAGPSLLSGLFRHLDEVQRPKGAFPNMRHASSGGDVVQPRIMERMKLVFPSAELFVIYGSTEVSCMGCTYPIPRDRVATKTLVGRPFPGVGLKLTDEFGEEVPAGQTGEILFSGLGLVSSYLNHPEVQREKFIEENGERFYRMGDLGRLDEKGQLEILGRRDFQVQIRGMRVEVVGVESLVTDLGMADQCAVILKELDETDVRLVAYVVRPKESAHDIQKAIAERVPDYMVPNHVLELEAMPLTVNGKLDRRALTQKPLELAAQAEHAAPRSQVEEKALAIFSRVLKVPLGIDDNFFDAGGHSLLVVLLANELENELGMNVSPELVFEAPTVRTLVERIQQSEDTVHKPIQLSESAEAPGLFLVSGVHIYRALARALEGVFSVYGVFAGVEFSFFDGSAGAQSVEDLAAQYVALIRRHQKSGPYHLGGISYGGIVAYEVARQLVAQGEEVASVVLFDAMLPERGTFARLRQLRRALLLSREKKLQLLKGRANRLTRRFRRKQGHDQLRQHSSGMLAEMEAGRLDAYKHPAEDYAMRVTDCQVPVTLIVAGRRISTTPLMGTDCGWSPHVARLDVHVLDADHLKLLEEPVVQEVARILSTQTERRE